MVQITSDESLQDWLETQDKSVGVAIAARAALRSVPFLWFEKLPAKPEYRSDLNLPTFRATHVSWTEGTWPDHEALTTATADAAAFATADATAFADAATAFADAAATFASDAAAFAAAAAAFYDADFATAAANDAAFAADAADAADAWQTIQGDVDFLVDGGDVETLMSWPLFPNDVPDEYRQRWDALKSYLLSLNENWHVWINWYEDRLHGGQKPNGRLVLQSLEVERASIPEADWQKGAAHVNKLIADMEARYQVPDIPPQRPAILEVEVRNNGKVHPKKSPPALDDPEQETDLRAAWLAHVEQFEDLLEAVHGNNDGRLQSVLKRYGTALSDQFETLNIMALGTHGERLKRHAQNAGERYLEDIASELQAMAVVHDLFIRKFPKWREHLSVDKSMLDESTIQATMDLDADLQDQEDLLDEEVRSINHDMAEEVRSDLFTDPETRIGLSQQLLDSEENIMAALAQWGVDLVRDKDGKIDVQKVGAVITILSLVPPALIQLWTWLPSALTYLSRFIS